MAPRRSRKRKVGLTRMDAALDAMRPLGFSDSDVRNCVKDLLKVYGDEGWQFIEEASYKVLIDVILEQQEQSKKENESVKPSLIEEGSVDGNNDESGSSTEGPRENKPANPLLLIECTYGSQTEEDGKVQSLTGHQLVLAPTQSLAESPQPLNRRRKPCYGWISEDDDDDDDDVEFVVLSPA